MTTRTSPGSIYISEAHLLDPSQKWNGPADLLVEKGRVSFLDKPGKLRGKAKALKIKEIEAKGLFLAPGFVDLNCRILEPGAEHIESFSTGSHAAAAGGFTTLLVQPVCEPVHDNAFISDFISRRAKEHSLVRIALMGALSHAREGKRLAEIGGMAGAGARAIGDAAAVENSYLMRKALEYVRAFSLPLFSFPEDRALTGHGVMSEGWNSNRLGLRGIPAAAEEIIVARDLVLLRHTKSRLHFQSLSTAGSLRALRLAKEDGLMVTAETNPAYFTLTSDAIATYDANFKCFPPLRNEEDLAAISEALSDGTIDCIASAHNPQTRSAKEQTFEHAAAGMISLETTLSLTMKLVRSKVISPMRLVELLSCSPARVLGLEKAAGSLRVGAQADFVLFDPKAEFVFEERSVHSTSRNSPFFGTKMQGMIKATFVGGTEIFKAEKERK